MKTNLCEAGHTRHDTRETEASINRMGMRFKVYDAKKYAGFAGYCTGQDDISSTLLAYSVWERPEAELVDDLLRTGDHNGIVLDFGTHIGWYSIIAAKRGFKVRGFEADPENLDMCLANAKLNGVANKVDVALMWVGEDSKPLPADVEVELMKCDIEGNEKYAVAMCADLFQMRKIKYALLEMSPVFNDSYPDIHKFLTACGYTANFAETRTPFDGNFEGINQTNLLYMRG